MKRHVIAALSIVGAVGAVGWNLSSRPEASVGLQDISLIQSSEHSYPGPINALAGFRIRLSPSDFGYDINAAPHSVPKVALAGE